MTTTQTLPRTPNEWVDLVRSGPAANQSPAVVAAVYRLWLAAFTLKMLGSSWDMSWHFKWLRDDLAPPHLLNTAGTVIAVALVLFQARYSVGVDRRARFLMVLGVGLFLIAIPIDIINHEVNGLDITAWSPSHAMLYIGTAFMLLGAFRGWWTSSAASRTRTVIGMLLWGFFLENVLFPSQHQEYGVLSLKAWEGGSPTAEPILLEFAANQIGREVDREAVANFALPVADWVYPAWILAAAVLTLVAARHLVGARWTATIIAGSYLAYRAVAWGLLVATGFPPSIPPFLLLGGAVAIDVVFIAFAARSTASTIPQQRTRQTVAALASTGAVRGVGIALLGTALATGAVASLAWFQGFMIGAPPIDRIGYLWGALVLFLGWCAMTVRPTPRR